MTRAIKLQFIESGANSAGAGLGTVLYQYGHGIRYLPERQLGPGTILIAGIDFQMSGYVGTSGATGVFMVFLDKKKYAANMSLYPLTQNFDNMYLQLIGQMNFVQTATNQLWTYGIEFKHPIEYVPGEDCLILGIDMSATSSAQQLPVWMPRLLVGATPAWMSGNPADIPDPDCADEIAAGRQGGNDQYTRLLLHGNEGPDGSAAFKDCSWRNYNVRWFGNCRLNSGGYIFDGSNAAMSPELYGPGFPGDANPLHIDWNLTGDFTWDMVATPSTVSNVYGPILTFTKWWGPFIVAQRYGAFNFYATTANSTWNVAENYAFGTAAANTPTLLSVERYGNILSVYQDGILKHSWTVTGPLFYPLLPNTYPRGRPVFGAQADISAEGVVDAQAGCFAGWLKEIRFSKIARYHATNFTPPSNPYTP